MIKNIFLLVLLATAWVSYAQPRVTLGKPYYVIDAPEKHYFHRGNELLTVKVNKKTIHLQKLNTDDLSFEKVRLYDDFPKDFRVELVSEFGDKYYVFYSTWDGSNEMLFGREIDFDAGTFKGRGKMMTSVNEKITGTKTKTGFFSISISDKYDFYFSSDASKMVVQFRLKPELRNDEINHDNIGVYVFDSNLDKIWGKNVRMPYTESKMNNLDYSVDFQGNAYMVTSVSNDDTTNKRKRDSAGPNYHIEIFKIASQSGVLTTTKVDLAGNFIKTLMLIENTQNYMTCAGFYNKGRDYTDTDGIITFKFSDNKPYDFKTYEIPVEIINQFESSRSRRRNENKEKDGQAEFESLVLKNIIVQKDGSTILLGEQIFTETRTRYNAATKSWTTYYIYHYNDMLATKIDPQGNLAWMKKLPKEQQGVDGGGMSSWAFSGTSSHMGGMSFYYFPTGDTHYLLYLDNKKNIDLPITEVPALHVDKQGGFLTSYAIDDKTGNVKKVSVLDTRDTQGTELFQFTPRRIKEISKTTFVFETYIKKKEDVLIKVEMPK